MALNDTLSIDIARRGTIHIPAKQADHGYDIICTILRNGENIVDASTDTATFRVGKPDNTIYYGDATVNSDNTVTIHVDDEGQMLAVPGFVVVDVTLNDGNGVVKSTQNFVLDVQAAPGGEAIPSWSVFVELEELVESVQQFNNDAEAYATGERGGVPVEEGDPAYHNNAAYYNAQAQEASTGSVRFDTAQTLTDAQKEQARENIDAATPDGYYESMTVGNAEQLVSTVGVEDSVPYNFRTTGGSADVGDRLNENAVVGGTVAWNQLVGHGNFDSPQHWYTYQCSFDVADGVATVTPTASISRLYRVVSITLNHKYLMVADFKGTSGEGNAALSWYGGVNQFVPFNGSWQKLQMLFDNTFQTTTNWQIHYGSTANGNNAPYQIRNAQCFDLTLMFGSTIADYIYSLEQANAGAGVAWFRKLFPKDYYAYCEPALKSVGGLVSHDMVGFNQWDEEWEVGVYNSTTGEKTNAVSDRIRSKNFIPVLPNTTYYKNKGLQIYFYDAEKNYINWANLGSGGTFKTRANAHYITFNGMANSGATYNHDICINLHWDGERDGEYEAYEVHSYALDPDLELRGIPKLDASGNLYYDGDTYQSDGTVTRRYGIVDLGTLTWRYESSYSYPFFCSGLADINYLSTDRIMVCSKYDSINGRTGYNFRTNNYDKQITNITDQGSLCKIAVQDSAYTTAADFKTAMSGVYLVYELATPTTETAEAYHEIQVCNGFGTEEYVDYLESTGVRDVAIPVGHESVYQNNLRAKLEMAPDSPDGDGDYIVRQTNGTNEYVPLTIPTELPTAPSTDGSYRLAVTVTDGTPVLSWVADS